MANFFTFLLIIFLIFIIFGIGFISRFVRIFMKQTGADTNNRKKNNYSGSNKNDKTDTPSNDKKIFTKDEGEYIDYEEIKDSK